MTFLFEIKARDGVKPEKADFYRFFGYPSKLSKLKRHYKTGRKKRVSQHVLKTCLARARACVDLPRTARTTTTVGG